MTRAKRDHAPMPEIREAPCPTCGAETGSDCAGGAGFHLTRIAASDPNLRLYEMARTIVRGGRYIRQRRYITPWRDE